MVLDFTITLALATVSAITARVFTPRDGDKVLAKEDGRKLHLLGELQALLAKARVHEARIAVLRGEVATASAREEARAMQVVGFETEVDRRDRIAATLVRSDGEPAKTLRRTIDVLIAPENAGAFAAHVAPILEPMAAVEEFIHNAEGLVKPFFLSLSCADDHTAACNAAAEDLEALNIQMELELRRQRYAEEFVVLSSESQSLRWQLRALEQECDRLRLSLSRENASRDAESSSLRLQLSAVQKTLAAELEEAGRELAAGQREVVELLAEAQIQRDIARKEDGVGGLLRVLAERGAEVHRGFCDVMSRSCQCAHPAVTSAMAKCLDQTRA